MRRRLDPAALEEVQDAMRGKSGRAAAEQAERLAARYDVHPDRIYAISRQVRPGRKPRADKGKTRANLADHEGLKLAAAIVAQHKIAPHYAVEIARYKGAEVPYAAATVARKLRAVGITRRGVDALKTPHRRFEATAPGEMFQIDATGLKTRWLDTKTRKLLKLTSLDVSRNHPNDDPRRHQVWAITLVDDYSRMAFVRFFACHRLTQTEMIDFVHQAFSAMGVPLSLYSDNDNVITGKRMQRVARILNEMFGDSGGFALMQHAPGKPRATGKVENAHKWVEEFERFIGVMPVTTLEELNRFAEAFCRRRNARMHRETGQAPALRWRERNDFRALPEGRLKELFTALEIEVAVRGDITIQAEGDRWQLPRQRPYADWAATGKKITVLWPPNADYFWITEEDANHQITRVRATPDAIGSIRRMPETAAEETLRILAEVPTAGLLTVADFEAMTDAATSAAPTALPQRPAPPRPEILAALGLPGIGDSPARAEIAEFRPAIAEAQNLFSFFAAVEFFQQRGDAPTPTSEEDFAALEKFKSWLRGAFGDRTEMSEPELLAALAQRAKSRNLTVVKGA
jgi:hypothetical protein